MQNSVSMTYCCVVCSDSKYLSDGVSCSSPTPVLHFTCKDCLDGHVRAVSETSLGARGGVQCPGIECTHIYSDRSIAISCSDDVYAVYMKAKEKRMEAKISLEVDKRLDEERKRFQNLSASERHTLQARRVILDEILTLRCPQCFKAFVDFNEGDCFALYCRDDQGNGCGAAFCGFCLAFCNDDAHQHVGRCEKNTNLKRSVFAALGQSKQVFDRAQRRRQAEALAAYLGSMSADQRRLVEQACKTELDALAMAQTLDQATERRRDADQNAILAADQEAERQRDAEENAILRRAADRQVGRRKIDTAASAARRRGVDLIMKFLLVGDDSVGKSSLLERFTEQKFRSNTKLTVGLDFKLKLVNLGGRSIQMQLWDTSGQERYKDITRLHYDSCQAIILIYDVTDLFSFEAIRTHWAEEVRAHTKTDGVVMLIGNKCDLQHIREVTPEEGKALADELGMTFFETSAQSNINVDMAFYAIANVVLSKISAASEGEGGVAPDCKATSVTLTGSAASIPPAQKRCTVS